MASTITLQQTINWALPFLRYAPVNIGVNNEPAISSANTILQTIISPPFAWKWNRQTLTFNTTPGTQDYIVPTSNYGWFETGSVTITGNGPFPLEHRQILTEASEQSRPEFISDQKDDDAGNITFRLLPVPDKVYTVTVNYQTSPSLFTSLSSTWAPIPDKYEFIYNWGFLALMMAFTDSTQAQYMRQLFVASLIGIAEGLKDEDKNLFMSAWLGEMRQLNASQLYTKAGATGRSM